MNQRSRRANVGGKEQRCSAYIGEDEEGREQQLLDLDEIDRQGARRMLAEALEAEVQD